MATVSYHHGNLRQVLLDHAVGLAQAGGPDAVVLRDVQRAAGVSNYAAYRHYADRQALLTAVQIHGMTLLGESMTESLAAVPHRGPRLPRRGDRVRDVLPFHLSRFDENQMPHCTSLAFARRRSPTPGHLSRVGAADGRNIGPGCCGSS